MNNNNNNRSFLESFFNVRNNNESRNSNMNRNQNRGNTNMEAGSEIISKTTVTKKTMSKIVTT